MLASPPVDEPPPSGSAYASPDEAVAAVLRLVRRLFGLSTALVVETRGGTWRVAHVDDAAFGLHRGSELPLRDTY